MGKKKSILLVGAIYFSLALSFSCAGKAKPSEKELENKENTSEDSAEIDNQASDSADQGKSEAASDAEGREAVDQIKEKKQDSKINPQTPDQVAHQNSKTGSHDGDELSFPTNQEPETLQQLLLEKNQMDLEIHKTCLGEISALTVNAKNPEALQKVTESVVVLIKDKVNSAHWCFFAIHHQLNRDINSSGITMDRKIIYFQKTMLDLVALAKGLDQLTRGERYISYNRERYISLYREQFGRSIGRVEGEQR